MNWYNDKDYFYTNNSNNIESKFLVAKKEFTRYMCLSLKDNLIAMFKFLNDESERISFKNGANEIKVQPRPVPDIGMWKVALSMHERNKVNISSDLPPIMYTTSDPITTTSFH